MKILSPIALIISTKRFLIKARQREQLCECAISGDFYPMVAASLIEKHEATAMLINFCPGVYASGSLR